MRSHEAKVRELARDGTISGDEADRLVEAMAPAEPWWRLLFDPFDRLSTAAGWAIAALVWVASIAVSLLGVRFDGAIDMHTVSTAPSFDTALFDLANAVLLTAVTFWLIGRAFAKRGRLPDYIVTVSIARAPLVLAGLAAVLLLPPPDELLALASEGAAGLSLPRLLIGGLVVIPPTVWFMVLLWRAFRVNSGLRGARLGVAFTAAVLTAEALSKVVLVAASRALPLALVALLAIASVARDAQAQEPPHPVAGRWAGHIEIPGGRLEVSVTLETGATGAWTGTADIPAQGARGLPLADISIDGRSVSFRLAVGQGDPTFTGTLSDDGAGIAGTFTQAGASLPFELIRTDAVAAAPTPIASMIGDPYDLETPTGTLRGTLLLPEQPGPHPVALLIAGSGPTDRDGNSGMMPGGRNDSLALLAEGLAERGIASVRYDKRGIAASAPAGPATEAEMTLDMYVDDAEGWVRRLREDPRFADITVIGHSEGSLIGMLAAERAGADGFVSIAGPGRRAREVLREQLRPQLPPDLWDESERILAELEDGRVAGDVPDPLAALYRGSIQPYLISWFRYDPAREIARLRIPTLIAQGTTDVQVGTADAEALHAARPDAALVIVDGMNHVLKMVPPDPVTQMASYSDPSLPVAPELISRIGEFIRSMRP